TRGIERKEIFKDDTDREEFLTRFEDALDKTKSVCYAWVLMPNHIHLICLLFDGQAIGDRQQKYFYRHLFRRLKYRGFV
ncbi:MAG: transposase, partial [Candidatus Omnitrophica bacterium]|nr:transposase [Candidatus Omnitrophota bacterium]